MIPTRPSVRDVVERTVRLRPEPPEVDAWLMTWCQGCDEWFPVSEADTHRILHWQYLAVKAEAKRRSA